MRPSRPASLLALVLLAWSDPARSQDPKPEPTPAPAPVPVPVPAPAPIEPTPAPARSPLPTILVPDRVAPAPAPPALVRPAPAQPAAAPVDAQAELDRLQGPWVCTSWIFDGTRPAHNGKDYASSYEGNRLTLTTKGREYRHGLVTLDPSRTPKAMNTWDLDGPFADRTNRAIYELDGDTLRMCIALDATADRPTDFTCEPGSRRLLVTYQRRQP